MKAQCCSLSKDVAAIVDSQISSLTDSEFRFLDPRRIFEISTLQTAVSMATQCALRLRFMHLL